MPSATFNNLPADKRERFVDAAVREFAAHPYDRASISRIVARLGIAKGSVYQYFAGKRDLFLWLVAQAGRRKLKALPSAALEEADFFERMGRMYAAGLEFVAREPRWARVALRASEPSSDADLEALRVRQRQAGLSFLRDELAAGQAEGAVRRDLELDLMAPLVHGLLSEGLMRAFLSRVGAEDPLDEGVSSLSSPDAHACIDAALALLRSGVGA